MEGQDKLHGLALRYLAVRGRSRWEMVQYLSRKAPDEQDVQPMVERLEEAGLIDDLEFARNWIRGRQAVRPRSRRMLMQELLAKRLDKDVVHEALSGFGEEGEIDALVAVAQKKLRLPQYQDPRKLVAYLQRQGFSYGAITRALERLDVNSQ